MEKSPEAFRTISEVADWLDTPAHVLRFWESRFAQVKPVKRAGGRRYYRPSDMALLGGIKKLLHEDGMTIRGVQKILRTEGVRHVAALSPPIDDLQGGLLDDPIEEPAEEPPAAVAPDPRSAAPGAPADASPALPAGQAELDLSSGTPAGGGEAGSWGKEGPAGSDQAAEAALGGAEPHSTPSDVAVGPGVTETPQAASSPEAAPEPTPAPPPDTPAPAAWQPPNLAALPPLPEDDDPAFTGRSSPFPLANPRGARARLAASPARAAALYERLIALGERMDRTR